MADITKIERAQAEAGSKKVYLRNAVILAYFIDKPVHEIGVQISAVLDEYLELIPKDCLKWVIANSVSEFWKPFGVQTITNCKKQLEQAGAKSRDITSFRLRSHEGEAPNYEFCFVGKPKGRNHQQSMSLLQMVFPIEMVGIEKVESFVKNVMTLSEKLSFRSGYCSPALMTRESKILVAYKELCDLAMRHPGYDVHRNMLTAWSMADKIRGARWITLLGATPLAALGGIKALQNKLRTSISMLKIGDGLMIRAGQSPELGDIDSSEDTPLLRQIARVLRPISYFGDRDLVFGQLEEDETLLTRWEERFFS